MASLRSAFSDEHKDKLVLESGYSSAYAFFQFMILPTICWKLGWDELARKIRGVDE